MNFKFLFALSMVLTAQAANAKVMIFGGPKHDQYLGCLDCNQYSSDSICNDFGPYGNEYSSKGIFNQFAGFGNQYSSKSPWNQYSSSKEVPVLVDEKGNFMGYFTINQYRSDAVKFAANLKAIFDQHDGKLEKVRESLCAVMGNK